VCSDEPEMSRLLASRRRRGVIIAIAAVVTLGAAPAAAAELGSPAEYDLQFPVDGAHHFSDTFWAARSHGAHSSQDIFADKGVPVVAAASGVVRLVNWTSRPHLNPERCCSVVIDHDDGWQSSYLHLNNDTPGTDDGTAWGIAAGIVPGSRVERGQLLGWVGDSGSAEDTAPHLHFELRDDAGSLVNSYPALAAAGGNATDDGISDPAFDGTYAIRDGDEGFHVRRLQEVLAAIGYEIGVDGDFGPATLAVVVDFQDGAGLTADGLFGRLSKQALAAAYAQVDMSDHAVVTSTLRRGSRGDEVLILQQALGREGHNPGGLDGIFGAMTETAVISYQRALGLTVDGIAGPQTLRSLSLQ